MCLTVELDKRWMVRAMSGLVSMETREQVVTVKSESIDNNTICTSEEIGSVPSVTNWTPASSNATFNPSLHNGRFVPSNVITWLTRLFEQLPVHAILYSLYKRK